MAPAISSINPTSGPASGGTAVTINGSGFTGATTVKFGTTPAPSFTLVSDSRINTTAPAGSGTVPVTVTTPAGTSNGVAYTYAAAPVITSLSPSQGPTTGGNTVTINGSGFTGATAVSFGAAPASFSTLSDSVIAATAPAGSGTVPVTVTAPAGTSNGVAYTYAAAPVITSLSPSQGPTAGGNTVTINGSGFTGATTVSFGTRPATITGNTGTRLTVTAPAGPAAPAAVTVSAPGGTSAPQPYYYIPAPAITRLDPAAGSASGGDSITVYGSNLSLTSAVRFGTAAATSVTVQTDNQLTATSPAGTGAVNVTATTPGGTSLGTTYYTYLAPPSLTALTPDQGPTAGGTSITITGSGLTYVDEVRLGGTPAAFDAVSDTELVATAPAAASPGPVSLVVHSPAGSSNSLTYQYQP